MDKKIVFIMGPGHCGSTLLDLILGSHSEGFSLGELHRLRSILDAGLDHQVICRICAGRCKFWNERVSLGTLKAYYSKKNKFRVAIGKFSRYFISPYQLFSTWSDKSVLIDSSKIPGWFKSQMVSSFAWRNMKPYLIYLSRDGRGVVNSYLRKYPERGVVNIIETWKAQIEQMNQFYDSFSSDRKIFIKYEELAENPSETIAQICDMIEIKYEKEMLMYWQHDHHPINGNLGTQSLVIKHKKDNRSEGEKKIDEMNAGDTHYVKAYYENVGMAIKVDMRWQQELSWEQLSIFDKMASDLNLPFKYEKK